MLTEELVIRESTRIDSGYASVVVLPTHPSSVTLGRNVALAWLQLAPADYHVDTALLLVTELLSDAITHADGALLLSVLSTGAEMRVELSHSVASERSPAELVASYDDSRHLQMVSSLADRWGQELRLADPTQPRRVVWFECASVGAGEPPKATPVIPHPRRMNRH